MATCTPVAASASGSNTIAAGTAGRRIRVLAFGLSFSGTVNAKFQSGSTDLTGLLYGLAGAFVPVGDVNPVFGKRQGYFETAAGDDLNLNLSGAVAVGGFVLWELIGE